MSSVEHNFSAALATWKEINLTDLQRSLDAQGVELVDNQKESVVGRKALAEKTKEFKKLPDGEKLNAFKGLLKAYQTEIDNLTKRSKSSENAFLNVYKVLAEAPDPYPLLEAAVDQTIKVAEAAELQDEVRRLRDENTNLQKTLTELTYLENTQKKLESKLEQYEQKMDDMIKEKVLLKENELNATYDEKLRNYEEREQDLQRQVSLAKQQLLDLRLSNESNQAKLLDHSQRQDQEVVSRLAELDMIVADLERANTRVATVERRNEILRAEIESMRGEVDNSEKVQALESQVSELEQEVQRMSAVLGVQRSAMSDAQNAAAKKLDEVTREAKKKTEEADLLKQRLRQYDDYDEIKRELEIMKYVEFGGLDDDADATQNGPAAPEVQLPNPNAAKTSTQEGASLEVLLATKNKRILEELTKFRILHSELEESLQNSQNQLQVVTADLERQRALNEKLENDLLSMNKQKADGNDIANHEDFDILDKKAQDSSMRVLFAPSADSSILPIVTSQRDRFRQRNAELEEELRKQFNIISELRSEVKGLQSDNLKLYEKVRYMQSYREESGSRPVTQLDPLPAPSGGVEEMNKYHARYEQSMNPFEAFRGREATRAYESLNPVERGVLVLTRAILGNRRARAFFVLYALTLHLMVMYTTYECTATNAQYQKQQSPFQ